MAVADLDSTGHLASLPAHRHGVFVNEPLSERDEVVALLFDVSDVNVALLRIERLLREEDDEAEEDE